MMFDVGCRFHSRVRIRNCLLSAFGLEGVCGIDWHVDSLTYQLSHFSTCIFFISYLVFSLFLVVI
ncbi:hypothetical protein Hanom_Chr01g00026361 [Helianthus anomalus]